MAEAIQLELERFAKPWYKARRLSVFRDATNLAASPELWPSIAKALERSHWFVLVASPDAARSVWVRQEVEWWLAHRSADRILIAQTAGETAWSGDDFDWRRTTALPKALAGKLAVEPHWIDLRPLVQQKAGSAVPERDRRVRLGDLVAEFAAPIHGVPKDQLIGAHVRERRRTRLTVQAVVVVLSVLLAGTVTGSAVAVGQRNEAVRQRDVAQARQIAAQAEALRDERPDVSLMQNVLASTISPVAEVRDAPQDYCAVLA